MIRNSLNTGIFRISFPLVYGLLIYILVLVFFGSADQILDNFFSQEALVCIAVTFVLDEALLLFHKSAFKSKLKSKKTFAVTIVLISLIISFLVVTLLISIYFEQIINLSSYKRELVIFNLIWGVSALLYSLVWISIIYIQLENEKNLQKEKLLEKNLREELNKLIYKTEPELFNLTLEHILCQLETNPDVADEYLSKLSTFYRYKLEISNLEYTELHKELENAKLLIDLYNLKYNGNISIQEKEILDNEYNIQPFAITEAFKRIINENIINETKPLLIKLFIENHLFIIDYKCFPKLRKECTEKTETQTSNIKKTMPLTIDNQSYENSSN